MSWKSEAVRTGVAVAIFNDDGHVLMIRRKGKHGSGTWSFPGGWQEIYETPFEAAEREVLEEVNLRISRLSDIRPFSVPFTSTYFADVEDGVAAPFRCTTLLFTARKTTGEQPRNMEPEKCEELRWHDPQYLPPPIGLFKPLRSIEGLGARLITDWLTRIGR